MADQNTGTSGTIRITASVVGSDPAGIWWDVAWVFSLIERVSAPSTWDGTGINANVSVVSVGTVYSAPFTFDWRPGGLQSQTLASSTTRVYGNPDGTPPTSFSVTGNIGDTGTSGAGGPSSVTQSVTLPTLTVVPGVPTSVAAARVSDSEVTVSWAQSSATNGQPTSNTIRRRINGGSWADAVTISPATSASLSAAANQKLEYAVKATNAAGASDWSSTSSAIFTTPGAPTAATATKVGSDIQVAWTPNVAFTEHTHKVEHSYSDDGGGTWSAWADLTTSVTAGTSTYTHSAPNPAHQHKYRVSARNTATGNLTSATAATNTVVLLTTPNKPTVASPAPFQDKAATFRFAWTHNAVDTTAQTKYQYRYSTNGGSSWATTSSKTTSANQYHDFAGGTWAANAVITFQVRTKGDYDSGSDGDASYSAWSDSVTVTFKTKPVVTIVDPADTSTYAQAALTVELGFSQAESATFVSATIGLYDGATLLEQIISTTLTATLFSTRVVDGDSYTVKATVLDSNGLTSALVESDFDVDYTEPVAATFTVTYLEDSGIAQLDLTIPVAGGGEADADNVTIFRTINGVRETVYSAYPVSVGPETFLDLTPGTRTENTYTVRTFSADGASVDTVETLTTTEDEWVFLNTGQGFTDIIRFKRRLVMASDPSRESSLVKASGRPEPIALFGTNTSVVVAGSVTILSDEVAVAVTDTSSRISEIESFLKEAGLVCYRDPSGRRLFGRLQGGFSDQTGVGAKFSYAVSEAS